jgi:hypothetical protein
VKQFAILLAVALAALAAVGLLLRGPAAPATATDSARAEAAVREDAGRSAPASVAAGEEAARAEEAAGEREAPEEKGEFRGEGSIRLRIVDASSDAPLADLPFVVYSERPRLHVFTRGVTDERGEASIGELPEDVIILETPRRPPHANTIFASWLRPGQSKEVAMRVGRGGAVRGRVVNDLGEPIEGVEVRADPRPGPHQVVGAEPVQDVPAEAAARFAESTSLLAKCDAAGRFEVGSLLARPAAIWIERGAMSPRRRDPIQLRFCHGPVWEAARVSPEEGEVLDLGDVVLARARAYRGRALHADGSPAAGCLVSVRHERCFRLGFRAFEFPFFDSRGMSISGAPEGKRFRFDLAP